MSSLPRYTAEGAPVETLAYERIGPVGWLRLNRPDRLNALTIQMWTELAKLGGELADDTRLRCLVVIGQGRAFSSGIDVEALRAEAGGGLFAEAGAHATDDSGAPRTPGGRPLMAPGDDRLVRAITDI